MSILIFLVIFVLTLFLQQWLHRHIQTFALMLTGNSGCALRLLFYLLLPGIVLHELSHFVVAKLLFVPTGKVSIGLGRTLRNRVSLGSVNITRTDPFRESLIGIAPFAFGLGAIWMLMGFGFDLWPSAGMLLPQLMQRIQTYSSDWTTWLDLYLVFAVSTAMIPSESDREPWGPVIVVLGLGVAMLFLLGWTPRVPSDVVALARTLLDALTFALGIAVIVNSMIAAMLWIMERAVAGINNRRIENRVRRRQ
jgi:hypothetical protein